MSQHKGFTAEQARRIGEQVGIDWDAAPFDLDQFRRGLEVELEHGTRDPSTNVIDDDPVMTGKIARAHLNEFSDFKEFSDYYTRLERRNSGLSCRIEQRAKGGLDTRLPVSPGTTGIR